MNYQRNCRRKNIYFEITLEQFHEITQKKCIYCDAPPANNYRGYIYNGVDRKNNAQGYVLANCAH